MEDSFKPDAATDSFRPDVETSTVGDFAHAFGAKFNPAEMLKGAEATLKVIREQPIEVAKQIFLHPYMAIGRGVEAMSAGKLEEAQAHFNSALSPAGIMTEADAAKAATPGQRAAGFGGLTGTGASVLLGAKAPQIAASAGNAIKNGAVRIASALPEISPVTADVVGVASPRLAHGLRLVNRVGNGARATEAPTIEPPALPAQPPPIPADPILDELARGLGGKSFDKLGPAGQETVKMLAARMKAQQGAASAASPLPAAVDSAGIPPSNGVAPRAIQPVAPSSDDDIPSAAETAIARETLQPQTITNPSLVVSPARASAPFSPSRAARQLTGKGTLADVKSAADDIKINLDSPLLKGKTPEQALEILKKAKKLAEVLQ